MAKHVRRADDERCARLLHYLDMNMSQQSNAVPLIQTRCHAQALELKRLKRLEKNRESARECRRRKKEYKEKLEQQLASLEVTLFARRN